MNLSRTITQNILDGLATKKPATFKYKKRKEKNGYTLLFTEELKPYRISSFSYNFLKHLDGKKTVFEVSEIINSETHIPLPLAAMLLKEHLKSFSALGIIDTKIKSKRTSIGKREDEVPSAPDQIAILLTNECNLRCSHCGNENRERKEKELTKEEWYKIIDQCAEMGVFIFNASGGEPFIRKDWFEILSYARKKGIEVAITSNSTLINEEVVKKLKELETFNIHLSMDGVGEVHDNFRNKKGVFESLENAISLLKKHRIPFGVTTAVSKRNFHNFENIGDFINENGIASWEIYSAIPLGCMQRSEALTPQETLELAAKIAKLRKKMKNTRIFVGDNLGYHDSFSTQGCWRGCRAGLDICAIDSEGNVKGCPIHPNSLIVGNLKEQTLDEIWNRPEAFGYNRSQKQKLIKQCGTCEYGSSCRGGCKASMYSQHGTFQHNDYCLKHIEEQKKT